jgi:asparagine synthase (glutamine-hydrolysing)
MSGIFGILNLDGQPVAHEHLEAMRASMAYWGPDGASIWQSENVGIGHLLLRNTPEAIAESLPRQHPASGVVLTAHARLDNREELIFDFRLPIFDLESHDRQSEIENRKSKISDSELILHAYLRWGEECAQHLLGDWAFAVWDPRQRKLFIARDHCGISSLYYYREPRFFAFASSIKALLALPQVPKRPNLLHIARVLTVWYGDDGGGKTAYEEILRLPAAHTLTVTADKVETRRYWFLENTPLVRLVSDDEYLEAFLEIYTEAVRCRLRVPFPLHPERSEAKSKEGEGRGGGIGATLSSGLDSGSVCALAARELGARGQHLPVFTSVPIYDTQHTTPRGRYGDESPLVELNRQFIGNLDVHYIRAENFSPLAGIERDLEVHDSPMHAAGNVFWIYALRETARQQGLDVLLTGQMGNWTISWMGGIENFWLPILSGQWQTLWSRYKRTGSSPWKAVKRYMLRPIVMETLRVFRRSAPLGLNREPWAAYSAINPQWAHSLDLARRMKASGHDPFFMPPSDFHQARLKVLSVADLGGAILAEQGPPYGLEVRDPTMDKRLMEFCLAIPDEQYRVDGQDRALIRRAMKGLLPDEVRLNTRRGLQAADLGHRILADLPQMQAMLARLEGSELARQVLDLPRMNRVLGALQKEVSVKTTEECVTILTRGMMVGMFLLRFE